MAGEPRLIKRYSNRKLYDTAESRYVTLEDIARLVTSGQEVRILDNASGRDITSVTLAQIILETERKRHTFPLAALKRLLQGANLGDLVTHLERGLDQTVSRVLGRPIDATPGASMPLAQEDSQNVVGLLRDWLASSQHALEDLQVRLDEHFRRLAEALSPVLRLQRQVAELTERVERLERLAHHHDGDEAGPTEGSDIDSPETQ